MADNVIQQNMLPALCGPHTQHRGAVDDLAPLLTGGDKPKIDIIVCSLFV